MLKFQYFKFIRNKNLIINYLNKLVFNLDLSSNLIYLNLIKFDSHLNSFILSQFKFKYLDI